MSWMWRVVDRWARDDDDEELAAVIKRLYGPLLRVGSLFPSCKRSDLPISLGIFFLFMYSLIGHSIILSVSLLHLQDDFDQFSLTFHYWLVLLVVTVMLIMVLQSRENLVRYHKLIAGGIGRYASGRIYDDELPKQYQADKRKQMKLFVFLPLLMMLLAGSVLLVPYLAKMDGTIHYNEDGANMKLPIATWYPFPTHEGVTHFVAASGQLVAALCVAAVVIALQLLIFRMTQELVFEYRVLQYALATLLSRTKKVHKLRHSKSTKRIIDVWDPAFQESIGQCLNECIIHHHNILKMVSLYIKIVTWPAAMTYFFGTGIIGLSLVNILESKKNHNYENIALFSLMLAGEVLSVLMISLLGEVITTESVKLRDVLYFTSWHKFNVKNRKTMLNFQTGLFKPTIVKCGGLTSLNLESFSSIMNTAYSFFNLMNSQ